MRKIIKLRDVKSLFFDAGKTITREGVYYLSRVYNLGYKGSDGWCFYEDKVKDYLEGRLKKVKQGRPRKIDLRG